MSTLSHEIDRGVMDVPARRHIQSIVVLGGGEVLLERYFRDRRPEDLSNVHSVTKSVLSGGGPPVGVSYGYLWWVTEE
jgi:hypothetical protein